MLEGLIICGEPPIVRQGTVTEVQDIKLTAYHVVEHCPGEKGIFSEELDVYVIHDGTFPDCESLPEMKPGDKVWLAGYFDSGRSHTRYEATVLANDHYQGMTSVTGWAVQGMSGGPVRNQDGEVVGMTMAINRLTPETFVQPIRKVCHWYTNQAYRVG